MKYKRYTGGFNSIGGIAWRAEIWQENASVYVVQEVAFAETPLEIEWSEVDKLEPVQTSKATLQLFSDTDRQFKDLYTIKSGLIRLDVYRNNVLYWSGTLDTELSEEPYSYKSGYAVSITFSDLSILDRLVWSETGFISLSDLVLLMGSRSQINYTVVEEHISTKLNSSSTENLPDSVCFSCANYYDEDGEAMNLREVLDSTIGVFGLRLMQKEGKLILYDLNDISTAVTPQPIVWDGVDAVLSSDKVYNNVKVKFSPYEKTDLLKAEVDPDSIPSPDPGGLLIRTDISGVSPDGFRIHLADTAEGNVTKGSVVKFFKIAPIYSGSEEAGVIYTLKSSAGGSYINYLNTATATLGGLAMQATDNPYLADVGLFSRQKYKLKINLSFLFDVRYNPFEPSGLDNEEGNWDRLKNWGNFAYVPFLLTLRDGSGEALYHWENKGVYLSDSYLHNISNCKWVPGEGVFGDAYLGYYNNENRKGDTGLGGWQTNKQLIGYYRSGLPSLFERMPQGEFIDLPTETGWLELKIGTGVIQFDYQREVKDIYSITNWVMYKNPTIELTDKYGNSISPEDVEHSAWLNADAKEELKLETVVGTLDSPSPTALGQIFYDPSKSVLNTFYRAGNTDRIERLLIGTVYSNYADRHDLLSGTCELLPTFGVYTDNNEPGTFVLLNEIQTPHMDESVIKMVKVNPDNYAGVTFE